MGVGELVLSAPQHEPGTHTWLKLVLGSLRPCRHIAGRAASQSGKITSALFSLYPNKEYCGSSPFPQKAQVGRGCPDSRLVPKCNSGDSLGEGGPRPAAASKPQLLP